MNRFAFAASLLASAVALACPVCGAATSNETEYQLMTLVMSALPLLTMGGIVGLIAYRAKKADRDEQKPPKLPEPPASKKPGDDGGDAPKP